MQEYRFFILDVEDTDFIKYNINWDGVASDISVDYTNVTHQGESYLVRAY